MNEPYVTPASALSTIADNLEHDGLPTAATMLRAGVTELENLRRWKAEAIEVLGMWESVWKAAGGPGRLGDSKADSTAAYIIHIAGELRDLGASYAIAVSELAEFKQWASDACELLHEILGEVGVEQVVQTNRVLDLLRRMEPE